METMKIVDRVLARYAEDEAFDAWRLRLADAREKQMREEQSEDEYERERRTR